MNDEFVEDQGASLQDWIRVFRRQMKILILVFFLLAVISVLVAILLPAKYRSSATILIQQQEIPQDMVRSTITSFADQRLYQISQRVMTSLNLWEIIERHGLYDDLRKREPREVVIDKMRDDIHFNIISADVIDPRSGRPTKASIAFQTSYDSPSPELAFKVANDLTTLYLNENVEERTQLAEDARIFLGAELKKLDSEILRLEAELAAFKEDNVSRLPEMVQINFQFMDRAERELIEVDREIQSLKERQIYLQSELAQMNPYAVLFADTGERIMSPADRLKALQTERIRMQTLYQPGHPDLQRIDNEIAVLKKEVGTTDLSAIYEELEIANSDLVKLKERYSANHPDIKRLENTIAALQSTIANSSNRGPAARIVGDATNPAYIQLASQLESTNAAMASMAKKKSDLRAKIKEYEQDIATSPIIEKEYRALAREYENANLRYQEIKIKLSQAELGESLEEGRKGERFELIEPAIQPQIPVFPNRPMIFILGVLMSAAIATGTAVIREKLDDSIRSAGDILKLVQVQPLATVPAIVTVHELNKMKMRKLQIALAVSSLLVLSILIIHFYYRPLDVMWFVGMRKLGVN